MIADVKKSKGKIIYPLVIILFLTLFHRISIINTDLYYNGKRYIIVLFLLFLLLSKGKLYVKNMLFKKTLIAYLVLIFANCLSCYLFRQQSIFLSIRGWQVFFLIYFYLIFRKQKLNIAAWERVLYILYLIILVGYILQNLFIDAVIFHLDKARAAMENEQRVRIYSDGILYLGTLFCWNKYLSLAKKKYLVFFVLGLLMIFLQGYRILIVSLAFILILMYFRICHVNFKTVIRVVFVSMIVGVTCISVPIIKDKIVEMQERADRDEDEGESMVRLRDIYYVYTSHFNSTAELILGSGMPVLAFIQDDNTGEMIASKAESKYSQEMSMLAADIHFFTVDLGILGLSWIAGIPFALLFIWLLISIIRTQVASQYYYLGMYCLLVLMAGATNGLSYKHGNILYIALILIILELANIKYRFLEEQNKSAHLSLTSKKSLRG